jgi:hypothetical protein
MSAPTSSGKSTAPSSDLAAAPVRVPHPYRLELVKTNSAYGTEATFEDSQEGAEPGAFRFTGKHILRGDPELDGEFSKVIAISRLQGDETSPSTGSQRLTNFETWIKPYTNNGVYQSTGDGTFNVGDMDSNDGKYIPRSLANASCSIGYDIYNNTALPPGSIDVQPMYDNFIELRPVDDLHHIVQTLPDGTTRSLIGQHIESSGYPSQECRYDIGRPGKWTLWGLGGIETAEIYDPDGDEMIIDESARRRFYAQLEENFPGQQVNIRDRAAEVASLGSKA